MKNVDTNDSLNIKIVNTDENKCLVEENCCTALTITLNKNGEVFTSFLGAYNNEIIKVLSKAQKTYYKNLIKKLKNLEKESEIVEPENENKTIKNKKAKNNKKNKDSN